METEHTFYHGFCDPTLAVESQQEISEQVFGVAPPTGWTARGDALSADFVLAGVSAMTVRFNLRQPSQLMTKTDANAWNALGLDAYAGLLFELSRRLRIILGRTSGPDLQDAVADEELAGALTALHWFQFLSPTTASRWTDHYLAAGPFERVLNNPSGGTALVLGGSPSKVTGRRVAAAYLGVQMRPIFGRNPATGERIVIPYD